MIMVTQQMSKALKHKLLSAEEQLKLWYDFLPLKEALRVELTRNNGGVDPSPSAQLELALGVESTKKKRSAKTVFSGGYRNLNLKEIYDKLPKTAILMKARRAQEKLIECNLPEAISVAHRMYQRQNQVNANGDNFAQAGCLGITYATYHYNPINPRTGASIKFSTYAFFWVEALIREEIKESRLIVSKNNEMPVQLWTETLDEEGRYSSIFDTLVIDDEPSLGDLLIEVDGKATAPNANGKVMINRRIRKHLSDRELTLLTSDNPLLACASLGLECSEDAIALAQSQKTQVIRKVKELIAA